ncbi:RIP metalloprotease RseP [Kiritimatiella glycovorans]|uniref:Zinc metalloprotease n=1 Tax=Kiritimatiella glycovorans TaxID=1307763 RepID=A0A0G3EN59_9BACT|nr:RIP metalloprotease RseP [Kiritimatiella glycovorans]AKJ65589.1 Regulator of sigma E protease [Kiritimatiella glycovorans]
MWMLTILAILILFGLTVFVHELGHFLMARWCGLVVETFSIGFGPAIFKTTRKGIVYKIGAFPFGGYVALPQLDPSGMEKVQGGEPGEKNLPPVSPWKKILVSVCGPLGNVVFALLLAWVIFFGADTLGQGGEGAVVGAVEEDSAAYEKGLRRGDRIVAVDGTEVGSWYDISVEVLLEDTRNEATFTVAGGAREEEALTLPVRDPTGGEAVIPGVRQAVPCVVGAVSPNSPAEAAGLQRGDVIRRFAGEKVVDWIQFTERVRQHADEEVPVTLERDGDTVTTAVKPAYDPELERAVVGIKLGGSAVPWMRHRRPGAQLRYDATAIFRVLKALVTPSESKQAAKSLGGPVMIFAMIFTSLKTGLLNTLGLIRFLNINLAVLNLLPLPVLDGGHIIFSLWEGLTRRPVPARVINFLVNLFAVLLIGAMILISMRDIQRLIGWGKSSPEKEQPQVEAPADPPSAPAGE